MESYLISAIVGLAGAIGILWKFVHSSVQATEKRLSDCEEDRASLWEAILHGTKSMLSRDPEGLSKVQEIATERIKKANGEA